MVQAKLQLVSIFIRPSSHVGETCGAQSNNNQFKSVGSTDGAFRTGYFVQILISVFLKGFLKGSKHQNCTPFGVADGI
jgi:hypothetical protein